MISMVLVCPASIKAQAEAVADAFGYGLGSYIVALSPSGKEPATHYATHAWVSPVFLQMLEAAENYMLSPLPQGITREGLAYVVKNIARSSRAEVSDPKKHFKDFLYERGLTPIGRIAVKEP